MVENSRDSAVEPLEIHKKLRGKIKISAKIKIKSKSDLSTLYTPGVAKPSLEIAKDHELVYEYTMKGNTVAIVTDGTRVLGLGDVGPEAALPVMEGKALIMQQFAGIDAFPICLVTKNADEIVEIIKAIAPGFGAINLEDIEAPKVFEIERRLIQELNIPVFHDDQHGTATVVLAGLYNSLKVLKLEGKMDLKIGIIGAGSAGCAIAKLLSAAGFSNLVVFDSKGAINEMRKELKGEEHKLTLAKLNKIGFAGKINEFEGAQVIISAAMPGALPPETIKRMTKPNIVFALSNPISEITLDQSEELHIDVFGSGRSDYPNQINNALCFPGFLRALLDLRIRKITDNMKIIAAKAIADVVKNPTTQKIVPDMFDRKVVRNIVKRLKEGKNGNEFTKDV